MEGKDDIPEVEQEMFQGKKRTRDRIPKKK